MNTFSHFVQNYQGNKLAILATGGGMSLASLGAIPGASRVLHAFYSPYETEETIKFLAEWNPRYDEESMYPVPSLFSASAVSAGAALELFQAMSSKYPDTTVVVVTAACTSVRWRRGENRAYIACKNSEGVVHVWHLKIPKTIQQEHASFSMEEITQIRAIEDRGIANTALALVGNITQILEGLKIDGTLQLVA